MAPQETEILAAVVPGTPSTSTEDIAGAVRNPEDVAAAHLECLEDPARAEVAPMVTRTRK